MIETVDSKKLASILDKGWSGPEKLRVYVQVNTSGEECMYSLLIPLSSPFSSLRPSQHSVSCQGRASDPALSFYSTALLTAGIIVSLESI